MNSPCPESSYDWPTLIVAILAFAVSGLSIWLQFRKYSRFTSRLVDYNCLSENYYMEFTYFFGNTGNVEYYLSRVSAIRHNEVGGKTEGAYVFTLDTPTIIRTNQVNLVTIQMNKDDYLKADSFKGLWIAFDFMSPDGQAISFFHEIKGIYFKNGVQYETPPSPNNFNQTINIDKLNEKSRPNWVKKV